MGIKIGSIKFLLALSCILVSVPLLAQWEKDLTVHKINGKKYYLHVVEKGNTVYGISKQYAIKIEDLYEANPLVKLEGLKVNQTLLIPVKEVDKKEFGNVVAQKENFLVHEVQKKETLFSLSKKYNVKMPALIEANPELKEGLKVGQKLKIPIAKVDAPQQKTVETARPDSLLAHKVKAKETLFSISRKYGVTIDELRKANNNLPIGLQEGMMLRIPGKKSPTYEQEVRERDTLTTIDTLAKNPVMPDSIVKQRIYNVALLLPFLSDEPDSLIIKEGLNEVSRISMGLYRGIRFALDSMNKDAGAKFKMHVYDSEKSKEDIQKILHDPRMKQMDMVIGPLYTDQFEIVSEFTDSHRINLVCPVAKNSKILFGHPSVSKAIPSINLQLYSLAHYIKDHYADSNFYLVNSNKITDIDMVSFFQENYRDISFPKDSLARLMNDSVPRVLKFWDVTRETVKMRFPEPASYTLMVPTENQVFLTQLLAELQNLTYEEGYRFRVFGLEKWLEFEENIEIGILQNLNVHLALPFHYDHKDYKQWAFMQQYHKKYGIEPDNFAMHGFDIALFYLGQLKKNGKYFTAGLDDEAMRGLVMDFEFFRAKEDSGWENRGIRIVRYDNFRLKLVN